ncbi:XRE family transcriptional regulator [Sinorhizobium medicae]|uniref:helix-turn-helix domain-containing protein n=1 Tax=Rhizobium meliloti TaxID=382 RepID=UPI000B4A382A|nr:hypothetical protein [Sinorhizobium meliloti]ASP51466.1 hypothetical protein CDO31_07715 [Sinorhizobium meliloti]MDX0491542.1 XRE family transcriptional regulator [Sinorhizobium medicae]
MSRNVAADLEAMLAGLKSAGMGPSQIAREAGVGRSTLWRFRVGDARMPSYDVVSRIEAVYRRRVSCTVDSRHRK